MISLPPARSEPRSVDRALQRLLDARLPAAAGCAEARKRVGRDEIMQGARTEAQARKLQAALRKFQWVPMLNPELAIIAARNYRLMRSQGITICKTIDLIIGTFCIVHDHTLLDDDRDFGPMEVHLGLKNAVSGPPSA